MKTIARKLEKAGLLQYVSPCSDGGLFLKDESGYWINFKDSVVNEYSGPNSHMIHGYNVADALEQIAYCRIVG